MIAEYIKACIYGIIEGISEWLPISSTGHLILFERILSFDIAFFDGATKEQFLSMFDVVIQFGAILAVIFLHFREISPIKNKNKQKCFQLWGKLILATLPAAVIGISLDAVCNIYFSKDLETLIFTPQTVASALIIYGILFILIETLSKEDIRSNRSEITYKQSFAIGCFQALAIIPGTSRSGATILGARILGISRDEAAKFSFLAAIPVISSASLLKIFDFAKYTVQSKLSIPPQALIILLTAGISAFAISMLTIKFLTDFVKKHTFIPFGIYRIILGTVVLFTM